MDIQADRREDAQSEDFKRCSSTQISDWLLGVSNGHDEVCRPDGTLVISRFVDDVGRPTVEQQEDVNGVTTYTLKKQNASFAMDNHGRILSYTNADHLWTFEPSTQATLPPRYSLPGSPPSNDVSATKSQDSEEHYGELVNLGDGLSAIPREWNIEFRMPDGLQVTLGIRNQVTKISKGNEFNYDFGTGLAQSHEDPNLPRDARLHDTEAIHMDAQEAIYISIGRAHTTLPETAVHFASHISQMPADKRVEYIKEIQKEIDNLEKDEWFMDRARLSYVVGKDGSLTSINVIGGSLLPYFSIPIKRVPLWHK